jgi:hypothetical protein
LIFFEDEGRERRAVERVKRKRDGPREGGKRREGTMKRRQGGWIAFGSTVTERPRLSQSSKSSFWRCRLRDQVVRVDVCFESGGGRIESARKEGGGGRCGTGDRATVESVWFSTGWVERAGMLVQVCAKGAYRRCHSLLLLIWEEGVVERDGREECWRRRLGSQLGNSS